MIYGIGTDLILLNRFRDSFPEDAFSIEEINDMQGDKGKLACNFAIKEAVIKAFRKGILDVDLKDIVVKRDASGAPYVESWPSYLLPVDWDRHTKVFVTLSHEKIATDHDINVLASAVAIVDYE